MRASKLITFNIAQLPNLKLSATSATVFVSIYRSKFSDANHRYGGDHDIYPKEYLRSPSQYPC